MQVQMNEQLERKTILQLRQQASASLVFAGIVEDYNKLQTYCKELQHRNSVLDKEGNLLRDENCNLQRDLEEAQRLAEKGFAAEKFEQKAKALEEQSSSTLKDHVKVLEDLVKCQTELQQRTAEKEQLEEELEKSQKLGQDFSIFFVNYVLRKQVRKNLIAIINHRCAKFSVPFLPKPCYIFPPQIKQSV
eukprot:TRINITY_DN22200_c0_g2_i1.p1 TRINITY_DN22200_c0_g2~~TRINITY_DN22200_c0_g2_i1.p1  ORF type:complete len:190 (+),score=18.58 TRINITY_DN22200_c0_g2_i1:132-701(+)